MRKRLHRRRDAGSCLLSVVAVGHEAAVADLITELGRDRYHGLTVVGACVAQPIGMHGNRRSAGVRRTGRRLRPPCAPSVPIRSRWPRARRWTDVRLRGLAWELEKTGTDLCVSPALLDVAGPRTTIRPTAGLTLLHVDHPQLVRPPAAAQRPLRPSCRGRRRCSCSSPLMILLGSLIWLYDRGPAFFTQTRVGKDGDVFRIYKFRTMVVDAEAPGRSCWRAMSRTASCSSSARIPGSLPSELTCGAGRSMRCRSCSTYCSDICRW